MSNIATKVMNLVRGKNAITDLYTRGEGTPNINGRGDSLVALALPPAAELVRHGESYGIIAASAVTPVVALPTTTAQLSLWNGEPDGGKSYVIDSLICMVAVSAGAATGVGFAGMLNKGRVTKPTSDLTSIFGLAGHNYSGKGVIDLAATVVDDGWHPIGNSVIGPASQIAMNVEVDVKGKYIIPPGGMFSMAILANTVTTITVKQGLRWHEVQLDLG